MALDIGGTKIYGALYNQSCEVVRDFTGPTGAERDGEEVFQNILKVVLCLKDASTQSVGISFAGFVDSQEGVVLEAPNIPSLNGFLLTKRLEEESLLKSYIENDAKLFALAEAHHGQDQAPKTSLGIIIGTGVGAGIIINGEVYKGAHGFAGEVGHINIQGKEVEKVLAGQGIKEFFKSEGWGEDIYKIQDDMKVHKGTFLPQMEPMIDYVAEFLKTLILTLNPDDIVFGGSVGIHFWSVWKDEIIDLTNQKLKPYPLICSLRISKIKNAGALGAGVLAMQKSQQ